MTNVDPRAVGKSSLAERVVEGENEDVDKLSSYSYFNYVPEKIPVFRHRTG